jgi:WD40 repeat protein
LCVAFSPDGKTLAASGGETVRLWNMTTRMYWDPATGKLEVLAVGA